MIFRLLILLSVCALGETFAGGGTLAPRTTLHQNDDDNDADDILSYSEGQSEDESTSEEDEEVSKKSFEEFLEQLKQDGLMLAAIVMEPDFQQRLLEPKFLADFVSHFLTKNLSEGKGFLRDYVSELSKTYKEGIMKTVVDRLEEIVGNVNFPIQADPQLGAQFTLAEWSQACLKGDTRVIQHFLDTPTYAHLLNSVDNANQSLSWAAFGYILGESMEGRNLSTEGFALLAQDSRVETAFMIQLGGGRVAFDEWLLQIADYSKDAPKQQRLNELKGVFRDALNLPFRAQRAQELAGLEERKNAIKNAQKSRIETKQKNQATYLTFGAALAVTFGGLYYYYHKYLPAKYAARAVTPVK